MNAGKAAVKWAGAGALSILLASTPAFAAGQRHNREQNNTDGQAVQTQVQTGQRSADRTSYQRRNGQQQANVAPAATQPNYQRRNGHQQVNVAPAVTQPTYSAQRNDQSRSRNTNQSWGNASQSQNNAYQSQGRVNQSSSYREGQRSNISGRVQSFSRERNGYRVHLDTGSYWIPESRFGNRARDLRVGVSLSLGGIFSGGVFGIDAVSWPASSGYG